MNERKQLKKKKGLSEHTKRAESMIGRKAKPHQEFQWLYSRKARQSQVTSAHARLSIAAGSGKRTLKHQPPRRWGGGSGPESQHGPAPTGSSTLRASWPLFAISAPQWANDNTENREQAAGDTNTNSFLLQALSFANRQITVCLFLQSLNPERLHAENSFV